MSCVGARASSYTDGSSANPSGRASLRGAAAEGAAKAQPQERVDA